MVLWLTIVVRVEFDQDNYNYQRKHIQMIKSIIKKVTLIAALSTAVSFGAYSITEVQSSEFLGDQFVQSMDNGNLVIKDRADNGGYREPYSYETYTVIGSAVEKIPGTGRYPTYNIINDGAVVWAESMYRVGFVGIKSYANGVTSDILTNTRLQSAHFSGDIITWVTLSEHDLNSDVYYKEAGTTYQVTNSQAIKAEVKTDGTSIVWREYTAEGATIKRFDKQAIMEINSECVNCQQVQIDNHQIVYQSRANNDDDWDIFLYSGGVNTQLSTSPDHDCDPIIDNGMVVWRNNSGLYLYNGAIVTQLAEGTITQYSLDNGQVVWSQVPAGETDSEVFVWNGNETIRLTDNTDDEKSVKINSGVIAWDNETTGSVFMARYFDLVGEVLPCTAELNSNKRGMSSIGCAYADVQIGDMVYFLEDGAEYAITVVDANEWWIGFSWTEAEYQGATTKGTLVVIKDRSAEQNVLPCNGSLNGDKYGITSQSCPFENVQVGDLLYFTIDGVDFSKEVVEANEWWVGFDRTQTPYQGQASFGQLSVIRN